MTSLIPKRVIHSRFLIVLLLDDVARTSGKHSIDAMALHQAFARMLRHLRLASWNVYDLPVAEDTESFLFHMVLAPGLGIGQIFDRPLITAGELRLLVGAKNRLQELRIKQLPHAAGTNIDALDRASEVAAKHYAELVAAASKRSATHP